MKINTLIENLIKDRFLARNFCTSFEKVCHSFEVHVQGAESITLPIRPKMARQLITLASPSKFGFKEKTLYDPAVRKSFEIEASKIQLGAGFWEQINASLEIVKTDLSFPAGSKLRAELHNMLIYEKGCFFDFHQDSEKEDGMMASLVIILPSNYRGGELIIEYQGQKKELGGCYSERNNLTFLAFYTDCLHALKKVTYGYRIALTFNLILESPEELKSNKGTKATRALEAYFSTQEERPKWFVYFLNHQYTPKSLGWKTLKGVDKEAAVVFKEAAQDLELDIYLAQAEIQETWNVVDDDYGHYQSRWDEHDDDDNDENDYQDADGYTVDDLVNSETVLSHWLDKEGDPVDFASHYVNDSMVFMAQENEQYHPENSEYEGFMGNYGNTLDRWYKRTAIVLWPKKISLASKLEIDANMAMKELLKLIQSTRNEGLIAYESIKDALIKRNRIRQVKTEYLIDLAIVLSSQAQLKEIFANYYIQKILHTDTKKIMALLHHFGDKIVSRIFQGVEKKWDWQTDKAKAYAGVIQTIRKDYPVTAQVLLNLWLDEFKQDIALRDRQIDNVENRDEYITNTQKNLVFLVTTLSHIGEESKFEEIFDMLHENNKRLSEIFIYEILHHGVLGQYFSALPKYKLLEQNVSNSIKQMLTFPRGRSDWNIDELPKCACTLCSELSVFLACSASQEKVWPLSKDKREHIHKTIDQLKLPVSHDTLRKGSPYKLILKKKQNLFSWRKAKYDRLRKLLQPCLS